MTRDEIRDGVVGERRSNRAHSRGMPDLARDPSIRSNLATPDLLRLHQHRLRERRQTAQVELQAPLALELVVDPRGEVGGRIDPHEPATHVLVEPLLELDRRLAAHCGRDPEPAPRDVDGSEHRFENRV